MSTVTGTVADPEFRRRRAAHAARSRHTNPENVEQRVDALAAVIRRKIDALPPLTESQRARLAALLRPAGGTGVTDAAS